VQSAKQTSGRLQRLGNAPIIDAGQLSVNTSFAITRRKSSDDDRHTKPTERPNDRRRSAINADCLCISSSYLLTSNAFSVGLGAGKLGRNTSNVLLHYLVKWQLSQTAIFISKQCP